MFLRKRLFIGLLLIAFLMSPFSSVCQVNAQASGEVLHVAIAEPGTIDPAWITMVDEAQVVGEIFSGLFKVNPLTGEAEPELAESWVWNAAADEITITLRSGLQWSDGHALTASDVRYGILNSLYANGPYASMLDPIENAESFRNGTITNPSLVGVIVDSATQVRFKLAYPMAFFEKVLSTAVALPIPEHVQSAHPDNWLEPQYIVSSGPYKLTSWDHGISMTLSANPSYFGPPPSISQVDIQLNQDSNTKWSAYLQSNLDTIDIPIDKAGVVAGDPIISAAIVAVQDYCTWALKFNIDETPFDQVKVRQAFMAAIDRQEIVNSVLSGAGVPTQTYIPPGVYGFVDGPTAGVGIPYNATQAQLYLSQAGYPNGVGFPSVIIEAGTSTSSQLIWGYIKNQLKNVLNIDVKINFVANPQYPQPVRFSGWCADYNEGYNFVNDGIVNERAKGQLGSWNNSTYNDLLHQISLTTNPPDRLPLYQQAEEILTETDAVFGPLYVSVKKNLSREYLERTFTGFFAEPWHLWVIDKRDDADYAPETAQVFVPDVGHAAYSLPENLFQQPVSLAHTVLRQAEAVQSMPEGMGGIGEVFRLDVLDQQKASSISLVSASQTDIPYTITVNYSPEQFTADGAKDERTLGLYAQVDGQWVLQTSSVDLTNHQLSATTQQINTSFAVFGSDHLHLFLPLLRK